MLDSRVYCNSQKIIYFYVFLLHITAFLFARVACSITESIICNPLLVQRVSSFLRVLSKKYCIVLILIFRICSALILKPPLWLSHVYPPFTTFMKKTNQEYKPIQRPCTIYFILKNISKVTNHSDSHGSPTYISIN